MDNKDFSNIGDEIRKSVQSAIDSMDFGQLNRSISNTVTQALDEAKKQIGKGLSGSTPLSSRQADKDILDVEYRECEPDEGEKPSGRSFQETYQQSEHTKRGSFQQWSSQNLPPDRQAYYNQTKYGKTQYGGTQNTQTRGQGHERGRKIADDGVKFLQLACVKPAEKLKGSLYTVLGGVGMGMVGILYLTVFFVASAATAPVWSAVGGVCGVLGAMGIGFWSLLRKGNRIRGRLKRLKTYVKIASKKMYCSVEELSSHVGRKPKFIRKELKSLIRDGILLNAHLDKQESCLMLNDDTYNQYLNSMESMEQEAERLRKQQEEKAREKTAEPEDPRQRQLRETMEAGDAYIRALREANDAIAGESISEKLSRLETVLSRIFKTIEKRPDQLDEMERFMEYYLPTTIKLINTYREFDQEEIQGENIKTAKKEIEETLDTINQAFERLLDDLFQDAAFDASTDASVLQAMLKKDGWVESDFDRRKES